MTLVFDRAKLVALRGTLDRSQICEFLEEMSGEGISWKTLWQWEVKGTEPRARTLLFLAKILGGPEDREAADRLLSLFYRVEPGSSS